MAKIAIVGAGHVGATAGLYLGLKALGELVLIDSDGDKARGMALDLGQALALLGVPNRVQGSEEYGLVQGSDVVIITAGYPRKPGMSRLDLLGVNLPIVTDIARSISRYSPDSVVIVVSNPLDEMTYAAWRAGGFPPRRIMGMAGVLDNARFKYFIVEELRGKREESQPLDINTMVLGSHGDTMVPLLDTSLGGGQPLGSLLSRETLLDLGEKTGEAGAEIVKLLKTGSAYFAPAISLGVMVEAVLKDAGELLPVTAYLDGEYGIEDIFLGVPARLGREGVVEIVEIPLSEDERRALLDAAEVVGERVRGIKMEG